VESILQEAVYGKSQIKRKEIVSGKNWIKSTEMISEKAG